MKKISSEEFEKLFKKIIPGMWNIEKVDGTLKIFNETDTYILPKELNLKVLDHVHNGKYMVVSVLGEDAKAEGLIRFCNKHNTASMQWIYHYELVSDGNEYVRSLNGTYMLSYYAELDKIVTYVDI